MSLITDRNRNRNRNMPRNRHTTNRNASTLLLLLLAALVAAARGQSGASPGAPILDLPSDSGPASSSAPASEVEPNAAPGSTGDQSEQDEGGALLFKAPESLAVVRLDDTSVVLKWDINYSSQNHLQFFRIQFKPTKQGSTFTTIQRDIPPTTKAYQINGLKPGAYFFVVNAVYDNDDNFPSVQFKYRLKAKSKIPGAKLPEQKAPEIFWSEASYDYFRFKWRYNAKDADLDDLGYLVYYRSAHAVTDFSIYSTNEENVEIAMLEPETPYEAKVLAYNNEGVSEFSELIKIKTKPKSALTNKPATSNNNNTTLMTTTTNENQNALNESSLSSHRAADRPSSIINSSVNVDPSDTPASSDMTNVTNMTPPISHNNTANKQTIDTNAHLKIHNSPPPDLIKHANSPDTISTNNNNKSPDGNNLVLSKTQLTITTTQITHNKKSLDNNNSNELLTNNNNNNHNNSSQQSFSWETLSTFFSSILWAQEEKYKLVRLTLIGLSILLFITSIILCSLTNCQQHQHQKSTCKNKRTQSPSSNNTNESMQFDLEINCYFKNSFPGVENEVDEYPPPLPPPPPACPGQQANGGLAPGYPSHAHHGFVNNHANINEFA